MYKFRNEGISEVIEMYRLLRVTIWSEKDGLLLGRDSFLKISDVAEMLKPAVEGVSEVIEKCQAYRG